MTGELQTCSYKYHYLPPGLASPHIVAGVSSLLSVSSPSTLTPIAMLCFPLLLTVIIFITFKLQTLLNISSSKVMSTSYWMTKGNYVKAVDLPRDPILSSILTPVSWTPGYRATMRTQSSRTTHSWLTHLLLPEKKIFKGFISLKMSHLNNSDHYCTKNRPIFIFIIWTFHIYI